jgi:prophage antirepressor-like protein
LEKYPKFADLKVYGTREDPLFSSSQVCELLGIARVKLVRDYELVSDYVYRIAQCKDGGMREQLMLTEQGLYNVIFRSRTEAGRQFRTFVGLLLKDLRLKGMVRLDEIIDKMAECMKNSHVNDHLYMITDGIWTKIGRSADVDERLKQLQTGSPLPLSILHTFKDKGRYEKLVHAKAEIGVERRGEWFKITDHVPLRTWIEELGSD